jgi:hypothetical protein
MLRSESSDVPCAVQSESVALMMLSVTCSRPCGLATVAVRAGFAAAFAAVRGRVALAGLFAVRPAGLAPVTLAAGALDAAFLPAALDVDGFSAITTADSRWRGAVQRTPTPVGFESRFSCSDPIELKGKTG